MYKAIVSTRVFVWLVGCSVGWLVGLFVGWLVNLTIFFKLMV